MRIRQLRALRLDDVQVSGDAGQVTYHASVFGIEDSYETIFDRGCFTQTITHHLAPPAGIDLSPFLRDAPGGFFPVVWFHTPWEPLALSRVAEDATGLVVRAELDMDTQRGRDVHSGMKRGYINCASHSFDVITEEVQDGKTHYKEVGLFETSPLTMNFASNPATLFDEIRSRNTGVDYQNPPLAAITERDLREMVEALSGLQHRELTDSEQVLVAECSVALQTVLTPTDARGEEPPTDIPTEPPIPTVLPATFYEARDLAAALSSRGAIRSPSELRRTPSIAAGFHALLTDIKALGHSLNEGQRK